MQGRIEVFGTFYDVAVYGRFPDQFVQIGNDPAQVAALVDTGSGSSEIRLGQLCASVQINIKGETAFIRAYEQTFEFRVVNPVDQARLNTVTSSLRATAPMPGVVVEVHVVEGDGVLKGQPLMTIESMKILTAIVAPLAGSVEKIHFEAGQPFEKGAVLVTLSSEGQ